MSEGKENLITSIIFVDDYSYEAGHIFNGNAFAEYLQPQAAVCGTRFTIFRHNVRKVCETVNADFEIFEKQLLGQIEDLTASALKRTDLNLVCFHDNTHYLSSVFSSLFFLKSFLDVYATLIAASIKPSQSLLFSSGRVDGEKVSGGKLINWLRGSTPEKYNDLSDVIFRHSQDWIHRAVQYRDTLVHYGDIAELHRMKVPLKPTTPPFTRDDILAPTMPHGEDVSGYAISLAKNLNRFLSDTIPMLPNVDRKLIDLKEFPIQGN